VSHSIFHPSSPEAHALYGLTLGVIILCGCILILVTGLVAFVCLRFRERSGSSEPVPAYGNIWLESMWTAFPLLILAIVMFFTIRTMVATSPSEELGKPDLIVIGHQWWWEVRYPLESGAEAVTANEVHIPVGKRLLLELRAADVIHDFWVPELGRKVDAIPGHPNQIWLQADQEGIYQGFCSEFCGASHAWMKIRVVAQNEQDYHRWLAHSSEPAFLSKDVASQRGLKLFTQKTCMNCHQISGVSSPVQIGPDLTHLAGRETLGAGVLKNNESDLSRWLENPDRIKPGAHMPAFGLTQKDLVAFLRSLQ
jgi:cytochrome c oxidase subunit 2